MGSIEFTTGMADRMRVTHDGDGFAVDFYDRNSATHISGRRLKAEQVKELVQFLAPPEKVNTDFQVGDRVKVLVAVSRMNQNLTPGTEGTVENAKDKSGAVGVRMDDGRFVSLNPGDMVLADTTTERVNATWSGFKVGDTVVEIVNGGADVIVKREVPAKPVEPAFGFGTAYVFGGSLLNHGEQQKRYRGFRSESGNFYYLTDDGKQRNAWAGQFEGFRIED